MRLVDRQTQAREAAEKNERERKAAERREKEREAVEQREHEREVVKARVQTILEEEESRKQLLAEDLRMGLSSSKHRQTEPVNNHREFMDDSEDEVEESRHYLARQQKKNTQEVGVRSLAKRIVDKLNQPTSIANL